MLAAIALKFSAKDSFRTRRLAVLHPITHSGAFPYERFDAETCTTSFGPSMIRLRLLGGAGLDASSEFPVHQVLVQPKRFALLAYLALESRRAMLRRDALLATFWPESGDAAARNSLSQSLSFLRRSLGSRVIVSRGDDDVGIDHAALQCDATLFDAACASGDGGAALELYGGELLPAFHLAGVPQFGDWLDNERRRLNTGAFQCASKLTRDAVQATDLPRALQFAKLALKFSPHDEASLQLLLQILDQLGQRSAAVREYEAFAARLRADLDLAPSPALEAFIDQMRRAPRDAPPMPALPKPSLPAPRNAPVRVVEVPKTLVETSGAVPVSRDIRPPTRARIVTPRRFLVLAALTCAVAAYLAASRSSAEGPPAATTGSAKRASDATSRSDSLAARAPNAGEGRAATRASAAGGSAGSRTALELLPRDRVAVLPFENLTGARDLSYVGGLVTDEILAGVMQAGHSVVDRSAVQVMLDAAGRAPPDLARQLAQRHGATILVAGSFTVERDSLRIRARVVDAATERTLFVIEPERGPRADPLLAIRPLRERVLGGLMTSDEARQSSLALRAPMAEAYREYERVSRGVPCTEAKPVLERLIALDSTYVDPYQALLDCIDASSVSTQRIPQWQSVTAKLARVRPLLSEYDVRRLGYFEAIGAGDKATAVGRAVELYRLTHSPRWAFIAGRQAMDELRPWLAIDLLKKSDSSYFHRGVAGQFRSLTKAYHLAGDHGRELQAALRGRDAVPTLSWDDDILVAYVGLGKPQQVLALADTAIGSFTTLAELRAWLNTYLRTQSELRRHGDLATVRVLGARFIDAVRTLPGNPPADRERLLAFAFNATGNADSCRAHLATVDSLANPSLYAIPDRARRALWLTRAGDSAVARRLVDSLATVNSLDAQHGQREFWRATLLAELGQRAEAMRELREAARLGSLQAGWHAADALRALHGYPPFEAFLAPRH